MSEKNATRRTRNFATVVYPESAPDNWRSILSEQFIPGYISPLHENDINPTGEPKKPHYHVIICFDSVKTIEQAKDVFKLIGGVGCEVVKSIRGYARYLCHLDNPEKAQYDPSQVINLCGADYMSVIGLAVDKYAALAEMQDFCEQWDCSSFWMLTRYAKVHRMDWFRILADCGSVHMREYLQSRKWSIDNGLDVLVNKETGEKLEF